MFVRNFILAFIVAAFVARAETITSQSQQFVVHASDKPVAAGALAPGTVEVVPEFLVVTAERVKQAVIVEVPALAEARATVHIGILNSGGPDSVITIGSSRFADGWRYEMAVPRVVDEARLVKGFINVLLIQYANRNSERGVELPAWVTEGLAEQLLHSVGAKLVVRRGQSGWEATRRDLQQWTRDTLRTNSIPSFQELTIAAVPARKSPQEPVYLASAHLLMHTLLEMPNGRERFGKFLQGLSQTWNWQTAFLHGFGFQRMLDVEKWWALTGIEFTTRDQRQAWTTDMSLRKLDELVRVRIEFRGATNALPEVRLVDLKTILDEDDATLQRQAIEEVISQLKYTTPYMTAAVGSIAADYQKTLETFLQKRSGVFVRPSLPTTTAAQSQTLKADTLRRLAALDQQRRAMIARLMSSALNAAR